MSRVIVTATAVAALLGFAPAAFAQVTGHAGVSYGRGDYDAFGVGVLKNDFYTLEGSLAAHSDTFGGAVDGRVVVTQSRGFEDDTTFAGTAHLNGRIGDTAILGVFGGDDHGETGEIWGVGLEAQLNVTDFLTLYAQGGYGQTDDLLIERADVWAGRADIRLYPTENLKLQASGGYQRAKDDFIKTEAWIAGVEAEYQLSGGLSVLAAYDHYRVKDLDLDSDIFRLGARYTFGGTLRQRERSGAALGSVQRLFSLDLLR